MKKQKRTHDFPQDNTSPQFDRVGKTSLVSRYCHDEFIDTRRVTGQPPGVAGWRLAYNTLMRHIVFTNVGECKQLTCKSRVGKIMQRLLQHIWEYPGNSWHPSRQSPWNRTYCYSRKKVMFQTDLYLDCDVDFQEGYFCLFTSVDSDFFTSNKDQASDFFGVWGPLWLWSHGFAAIGC